jgi:hypothetical protein
VNTLELALTTHTKLQAFAPLLVCISWLQVVYFITTVLKIFRTFTEESFSETEETMEGRVLVAFIGVGSLRLLSVIFGIITEDKVSKRSLCFPYSFKIFVLLHFWFSFRIFCM